MEKQTVEISVRAPEAGTLPDDGATAVAGVALPPGERIRPEQYMYTDVHGRERQREMLPPFGWYSGVAWGDTFARWLDLARVFQQSGLWPVAGGPALRCGEIRQGNTGRAPSRDHGNEAANVLQQCWDGMALVDAVTGEPRPEKRPPFPGVPVKPVRTKSLEVIRPASSAHWGAGYSGPEVGLLLVPATSPAEVPGRVGWTGAANYSLDGRDISAVLGSWQDRYGAVLYQLGDTTMTLLIARPPVTAEDATALAAEHYLFCTDNFFPQDYRPPISASEYAQRLLRAPSWDFWWD